MLRQDLPKEMNRYHAFVWVGFGFINASAIRH